MSLPSVFALKSCYNGKYLNYVNDKNQNVHGLLRFSGECVLSPYDKFEVEPAKSGNGRVHIKCSYNKKYWVRRSPTQWWIVALADEPNEDECQWTCTLFKPIFINETTLRFRHVQLGHYACLWRCGGEYDSGLLAGSNEIDKDICDVLTIIK